MSKAGKMIKGMLKAKKESVMGKLANGDDPMEPWSKRFDSPIKEEDTWLYRYIRSLGWDPSHMTFAQQSKYSRSNAFKTWKKSHMELTSAGSANEEVEELDEAGTGLLMSYIKAKGLDPRLMDGNQKASYSRSSEFRKFKNNHVKEASGMGERGDDWNEASSPAQQAAIAINMKKKGIKPKHVKEEADAKDTVCMDIPLLIRVLEFTREDMKTDVELHNMVERLIDMRHEVPLSMEHYDAIIGKLKEAYGPAATAALQNKDPAYHVAAMDRKDRENKLNVDRDRALARQKASRGEDPTLTHAGNAALKSQQRQRMNNEGVVDEASWVNGVKQDPESKVWKLTSMSHADAVAKHGKENVRHVDAVNRSGDKTGKKHVEVLSKLGEEVEQIDELSKGTLTSYATKARADASNLSKQGDAASKRTSTKSMGTALEKFRKATKRNMGAASAESKARVKEEKIDELKKIPDNMEIDDHITREDLRKWFSKTDPEGDWKRINSKGEAIGPCAREPGEPKPKCMSKEKRQSLSKKERASAVSAKRKHDPDPERKGKPINVSNYGKGKLSEDNVDEACWDTHKQEGMKKKGNRMVPNCVPKNEDVEQVNEKNSPTNSKLWARAKSMARSKFDVYPSAYANGWASKWYKSKGGGWKSVKEDGVQEGSTGWHPSSTVKNPNFNDELSIRRISPSGKRLKSGKLSADERGSQERTKALMKYTQKRGGLTGPKGALPEEAELQEGIYGIEDSPLSATNSVKAMESAGRRKKEMSKSARMIKAIYKKKNVKETLYDWEKSEKGAKPTDEPTAKIIMKGGTTMTGKPRDTVEIGPVLRTKLNSPAGNKPSV